MGGLGQVRAIRPRDTSCAIRSPQRSTGAAPAAIASSTGPHVLALARVRLWSAPSTSGATDRGRLAVLDSTDQHGASARLSQRAIP